MIEISVTEILLLAWAAIATASWLSVREEARIARKMLVLFIENPEARSQMIKAHEEFTRRKEETQ